MNHTVKVIVYNSLSLKYGSPMFCKSGILIFIFAENNYSIYAHTMLIKTPLLHQSSGPHVFLSLSLSLSLSLFQGDLLERRGSLSSLSYPGF